MKLTRKLLTSAIAFASILGVSSTSFADTRQDLSKDSVIETIKQRSVLKVGISLFKPWSMRDKNGELIGFEVDVARKIADDMGVDIEFSPTSWDGIIPALVSGKFDAIISGMSITPKRNLTVNFSDPYGFSGMTVLANKKMTEGFKVEDFNRPEVTFAARRGATPAATVSQVFPKATLLLFDEDGASTQEVLNGRAHATMASEPFPSDEARRYPETLYIPFDDSFNATGESIAIRKGDPDALNFFNNWIGVHTRNGWLKERSDYWFKGDAWKSEISE